MLGWQIGVLVVICVVFVVGVLILCFLIYRFWGGIPSDSSDETVDERTKREERYEQLDHVESGEGDILVHIPDGYHFERLHLKKSDHVLHYLNLERTPKTVDFKAHSDIVAGADLQGYIARAEGMDCPDTIGLTYVNAGNELVDMDLDQLIRRDDNFAKRMRHTAERPLLLGRLTELVLGGASAAAAAAAPPPRSAVFSQNPFGQGGRGVNVNVSLDQQQQQQQQSMRQQQAASLAAGSPPLCLFHPGVATNVVAQLAPADSHVEPTPVFPGEGSLAAPRDTLPTPMIFPSTRAAMSHVTTTTPIFILAAQYFIRSVTPSATGAVLTPVTDEQTVKTLERAMAGESERSVYLDSGAFAHCTVTVAPERGTATLQHPSGRRHELIRRGAPVIHYSIDRTTSAQWTVFTGPFYLPPGRWCVRAKSCSAASDPASSAVVAKVFTVNVV